MTCLSRQSSPVSSSPFLHPSVIFCWQRACQSQQRPVMWLEPCFLTQVPVCVEFWVPAPLQMWRQSNSCGSDRLARALTATKSRDTKTSRQTESSLRAWPALSASLHVSLCLSVLWFVTIYSGLHSYSQTYKNIIYFFKISSFCYIEIEMLYCNLVCSVFLFFTWNIVAQNLSL